MYPAPRSHRTVPCTPCGPHLKGEVEAQISEEAVQLSLLNEAILRDIVRLEQKSRLVDKPGRLGLGLG